MVDLHFLIIVAHIALIMPILLFVGFQRAATPDWIYQVLFGFGILVLLYHGYRMVGRWAAKSPKLWVNAIHVAFVAPLLMWIGFHGKKTERPAYELLLILAFGGLGWHLYHLAVLSQTFVKPGEA
jgi:hypothetical protein